MRIDYDRSFDHLLICWFLFLVQGAFIALLVSYTGFGEPPKVILPTTTLPTCVIAP
ncbi:hypothetical protein [Kamptonema sp. UHCC 0994]|uniref:hypothetical protein n=1 Tax=Kamptonema sp. UHCC 0994 TaxID=3031329 RepID=UPI0023BA589F|nr:hypothetical protein [Kamptonema sp. UHCC 0994]MDF0556674.1 hypothetical protein [Kamptonema sp. UHCC 0994]